MGASRGAIRAARYGTAVFLPLAVACVGLFLIFVGPTAAGVMRHALTGEAIDTIQTGSVPAVTGYGIDEARR
jgi:xanthosine utilization system XapX-like protein